MDLRDYVRVLRNRWRILALCLAVGTVLGAVYVIQAQRMYESQTQMFVSTSVAESDPSSIYQGGQFSVARVQSYADFVGGPLVADRVANIVGGGLTAKTVENEVSAKAPANTVLLNVNVTDPSPQRAQRIAAAIGQVFPSIVEQVEATNSSGQSPVKVSVVKPATFSSSPVSPRAPLDIGLALMVGLLAGVGGAILLETLDNTVKTPDQVLQAAGTSVIGSIAFDPDARKQPLIAANAQYGGRSESFRQLRTNLQFLDIDSQLRSIVFTSSVPGEGKTTTVCNLAITVAQTGVRVLLIEADLRRPRVGRYLGMDSSVGLTSVLVGTASLDDAIQTWRPGSLLDVLPSGQLPPNPSELLGSRGMSELLSTLEDRYDLVMLDAPPLLPVTDAAIIAAETTGAVIVIHHGSTRIEQLARTTESLATVGARVLGAVMNFTPRRGPDAYYYGHAYRYLEDGPLKPPLEQRPAVVPTTLPTPVAATATLNGHGSANEAEEAPTPEAGYAVDAEAPASDAAEQLAISEPELRD